MTLSYRCTFTSLKNRFIRKLVRVNLYPPLLLLIFVPAFLLSQDFSNSGVNAVDSLLVERSFEQARRLIIELDLDEVIEAKYLKLCDQLTYLTKFDQNELLESCNAAKLYQAQFVDSIAGHKSARYYEKFNDLSASQEYHDAVVAYRIAKFYRGLFIYDIRGKTVLSMDASEVLFSQGSYEKALDLLLSVEEDLYRYLLLKEYRWHYEALLEKYEEALLTLKNKKSLTDRTFKPNHTYDLSLNSSLLLLSSPFEEAKPVLISHSSMTAYESYKYLSDFKASGGISLGIELSSRFTSNASLNLKVSGGRTYYSGFNDSTGLSSNLSANHQSLALGILYHFKDHGRVNLFSSLTYCLTKSTVRKVITKRHPYIEEEYYYIAPISEYDNQLRMHVGASYYPISTSKRFHRASVGLAKGIADPSFFGDTQLIVSFSTGYFF